MVYKEMRQIEVEEVVCKVDFSRELGFMFIGFVMF